eukprot:g2485.t1
MSRSKSEEKGDKKGVPSYMRETLSSLRKNRERVSSSCTPRGFSGGTRRQSECFDDIRQPRGTSVGPMRKSKTVPDAEPEVPRYMRPTRSSSQKGVGDKYQIKPPRPPSAASSDAGATPTTKRDVKRAERRIQRTNVAMSAFVETLRQREGSATSESSTVMNNMTGVGERTEATHNINHRVTSDRHKTTTGIRDGSRSKSTQKGRKQDDQTPRFMQPTAVSVLKNCSN